jgi:hypothetical protein
LKNSNLKFLKFKRSFTLVVAFSNRLWKSIFTGGCHKPTISANVTFTLAASGYKVVAHPFLYTAGSKVTVSL